MTTASRFTYATAGNGAAGATAAAAGGTDDDLTASDVPCALGGMLAPASGDDGAGEQGRLFDTYGASE